MIAPEVGAVIGGLRIDAVAGRGGMGVVYKAHELALDRTVAMKIVNPELANDPEFRERFRREARLAASIDHPHIVPVYRTGEDDGHVYLTMRYVDGTDLTSMIATRGRLDPRDAVEIIAQIADALDAAHARGLVHRDVKPANILVTAPNGRWHTYLTDFGISKDAGDAAMTKSGVVVGSLSYISPEQLQGDPTDGRSDVYALGCVLFQALTGEVPFPRDTTAARMFAHINATPPALGEVVPTLRGPLEPVIAKALAKRPQDRFATAGEFGRAARAALAYAPSGWMPPPTFQQMAQPMTGPPGPMQYAAPTSPPRPMGAHPSFPGAVPMSYAGSGPMPAPAPISGNRKRWVVAGIAAAVVAALVAVLVFVVPALRGTPGQADPVALPPTGRFVGKPIAVGTAPLDAEQAGGAIWTADSGSGTITKVDPVAGTSTRIPVQGGPGELVASGGRIWVWNYSTALTPVDMATGAVGELARTELDISHLAATDTRVWFSVPDRGEISSIDSATGQLSGPPVAIGKRPDFIATGGGKVYVVDSENRTLVTVDDATRAVVGSPVALPDGINQVLYESGRLYLGGTAGFLLYPGSGPVTTDQLVTFDCACAFVAGPRSVIVFDDDGGAVRAFSTDLRTQTGEPLPGLAAGISDVVLVDGTWWFVNRNDDAVRAMQPTAPA